MLYSKSYEYRRQYVKDLLNGWNNQLALLSSIAEGQPQTTHLAFVSGFKNKLNYFMRTFPGISQFFNPLKEAVRMKFIPATTGGHICNNNEQQLLSLPNHYDELAIPIFHELAESEFENSRKITSEFTPLIINQSIQYG